MRRHSSVLHFAAPYFSALHLSASHVFSADLSAFPHFETLSFAGCSLKPSFSLTFKCHDGVVPS